MNSVWSQEKITHEMINSMESSTWMITVAVGTLMVYVR